MAAIKIIFHVSIRVIVPMLQHRPFQNIKTDGNEFKMFYKNNVIYWLIHIDFRDLQIHNSLGKYFLYLNQCELISISKSYELIIMALCVLFNVG